MSFRAPLDKMLRMKRPEDRLPDVRDGLTRADVFLVENLGEFAV